MSGLGFIRVKLHCGLQAFASNRMVCAICR